jgi:hypothetical protein
MAKYLSYKIQNNIKSFFKFHSSDASKTWWNERESNLNYITITDSEYDKLKKGQPFLINSSNQLEFDALGDSSATSLTIEDVTNGLNEHIRQMEKHLANHETPLITQSNIDTLKSIDLDSITWPTNTFINNWVEVCENNSITIDFINEI